MLIIVLVDRFCGEYVPESEERRHESWEQMAQAYKQAEDCWYQLSASCPLDKRSQAKIKGKQLSIMKELHTKEVESIPKPKRAEDNEETKKIHKRDQEFNILFDVLEGPFKEDPLFSYNYCERKLEYNKFQRKALWYKIEACNETRAYLDCQKDAYNRFTGAYQGAYTDCQNYKC